MAAFNALGSNVTVGQVSEFVTKYFKPERQELEAVAIEGFVENPAILNNISDPIYKAWTGKVNSYWELLIRQTNQSALCQPGQCESSLIPLNHTIVVPGGRYGEIYYWDSFWILEGLLASELYHYAWNLLQNMFDMVEEYGFVPNGGRKYYLNRSQPPVLTQMVAAYVRATGNVTVLERGLPLLHQELEWFQTNRTLLVTSPYSNVTHRVARWAVNNTAPRPEGYIEDYEAANKADPPLNASQRADLYAELASGAESGWDYTGRWAKELILNKTDNLPILRTLNVRGIVPVDLTALLAGDHSTLAGLYEVYQAAQKNGSAGGGGENLNPNVTAPAKPTAFTSCVGAASGGGSPGGGVAPADGKCGVPESSNSTTKPPVTEDGDKIMYHRAMAANYSAAVTDLHWDPVKAFWYDFNMTSMTRSDVFTPAGLWPLWLNVTPPALLQNETLGLQVASGLRFLLGQYPGSPSVSSLLDTGLNWDFPNVWPPHAYTTIKAMENLGRLIPMASSLSSLALTSFSEVAPGQFGMNVTELPTAALDTLGNSTSNSTSMPNDVNNSTASGSNATAIDVGAAESNATAPGSNSTAPGSNMTAPGSNVTAPGSNSTGDLPWPKALAIEIASRYMTAAFCSWYSTGGALPGILAQLPLAELNATGTYKGDEGHMFEKFDVTDIDAAGGGGEYEVSLKWRRIVTTDLFVAAHCQKICVWRHSVTKDLSGTSTVPRSISVTVADTYATPPAKPKPKGHILTLPR
jgi:alpha,alpha-trehalase